MVRGALQLLVPKKMATKQLYPLLSNSGMDIRRVIFDEEDKAAKKAEKSKKRWRAYKLKKKQKRDEKKEMKAKVEMEKKNEERIEELVKRVSLYSKSSCFYFHD